MRVINIDEAETKLIKIVEEVRRGNEFLITIAGKLIAKLSPINKKPLRRFGMMEGKIKISKDFDAPLS